MEFTDLQLIVIAVVLTATALLLLFDYRRKQRPLKQPQPVRARFIAVPRPVRRPIEFDPAALEYFPAKRVAAEPTREPLAPLTVVSNPPEAPAPVRETVTIELANPLDGAHSDRHSPAGQTPEPLPAFTIDAALWERLIASMPSHDLLTAGDEQSKPAIDVAPGAVDANYQVIENEAASGWPTGVVRQSVFQKLLDDGEFFSGLVVSIGVNDNDSSMWHSQGLMHEVGAYLAGLLRASDFSCRTDYDEFIQVFPGETGAPAQRRLSQISERLWDYQLRGMGTSSILFSWGGVQVQDQPLAEAVASAVDRMRQTRRLSTASALTRVQRTAV